MRDYPLERLGETGFEQLVAALALKSLGPAVQVFGLGPDGGRDAASQETISAPDGSGTWTGHTVVQAKFRSRPGTPSDNEQWLVAQAHRELAAWRRRIAQGVAVPDNFILASNVIVSGVRGRGVDAVEAALQSFKTDLGVNRTHLWHYDHICRLLDDAEGVRRAHPELLTVVDLVTAGVGERPQSREPVNFAPAPPAAFIARREEERALLQALKSDDVGEAPVGLVAATGVHGTGGYGKTSLAAWACHHAEILKAFPDGVLWVELGRDVTDERLVGVLADFTALLGDRPPRVFSTVAAASAALAAATRKRRALIVVDDVWRSRDLEPFLGGDPACRRLVTTRRPGVLPAGGPRVPVGLMTPAEASALLGAGLDGEAQAALFGLYERSGRWPLALALLNGVIRSVLGRRLGLSIDEAVAGIVERWDRLGAAALDGVSSGAATILASLELSIDELKQTLGELAVERIAALAAYPEGRTIAFELLEDVWHLDRFDARRLSLELEDRSLLSRIDEAGVRLHDEIRDHLRRSRTAAVEHAHERAVEGARRHCPEGWHVIADRYPLAMEDLAYHLVNAGHEDELRDVLTDLRYHVARLRATGPAGLSEDVEICATAFARDPFLGALARCVSLEAHLALDVETSADVAATWFSRLCGHSELASGVGHVDRLLAGALVAARPFPDQPDPRLARVLHGHRDKVMSLAWRADGTRLITASSDGTGRIWDVRAGRTTEVLRLPEGSEPSAIAASQDARYLLFGAQDRLALFDAVDGDFLRSVPVNAPVHCVTFAPDSSYALVGTGEQLLTVSMEDLEVGARVDHPTRAMVWAAENQALVSGLAGLICSVAVSYDALSPGPSIPTGLTSVRDIALHPRGDVAAVVGAGDSALLVDPHAPQVVARSAPREVGRNACSWSPDGATLVTGTADGHLDFWTDPSRSAVHFMPESEERQRWEAQLGAGPVIDYHGVFINDVAWQPHGKLVAVAASAAVVRLWTDTERDPTASTAGALYTLAWQPHGELIAAGGLHGELLVTSADGARTWTRSAHVGEVRAIAWSPDGARIASRGDDGHLILWHMHDEPTMHSSTHIPGEWPGPLVWTSDGETLIAANGSEMHLLDVGEVPAVRETVPIDAHVSAVAAAPDDATALVGTAGDELVTVDLASGSVTRHAGPSSPVVAVRAGASGAVVSCGHRGELLSWTTDSWTPQAIGTIPTDTVWDMDLGPDGSTLLVASSGGLAFLSRSAAREQPQRLKVDSSLSSCALSPDATSAALCGRAGLYVCKVREPAART